MGPGSRWFLGPNFLLLDESQWPQLAGVCQELPLIPEDLIKSQESKVFSTTLQDVLLDFGSFYTLDRLIRHVALLFKFISRCQKSPLSESELRSKAELYCIQQSQPISFSDEISCLKRDKSVDNDSNILSLSPFLDSRGILCLESRISYLTHLSISSKPIILYAKDRFSVLLIKHFHTKFFHASHETVLNEIRQRYWMVGFRRAVKKIVSKCTICKFLRTKPSQPRMASLPDAHLGYRLRVFHHCGMDYFGPLVDKVERKLEK